MAGGDGGLPGGWSSWWGGGVPSAPPSLESVPNCGAHPDPLLQPGSIFPARSPPAQLWRAGEEGCADSPRCSLPWWRPMLSLPSPCQDCLFLCGPSALRGYVSVCRSLLFPVAQVPSRELAWGRNLVAKVVASLEGSAWASQLACCG